MGFEHSLETLPLFLVGNDLVCLNFPSVEKWNLVDNEPWQTSTEVHDFVGQEKQEPGGQDIVVHVYVPGSP